MGSYIVGRIVPSLVLLVLVSMIGFAVLHLAPGGPLASDARRLVLGRGNLRG
jgi:peptide/nickel transport system permease protein